MPRPSHIGRLLLPMLTVIALATTLAACNGDEKAAASAPEANKEDSRHTEDKSIKIVADDARRAGLKVERIEAATIPATVALFGTVEANRYRLAHVVSPVAGRVIQITAGLGDQVESDAVLAIVESPQVGAARATYQQAQAELALAETNLKRTQRLVAGELIAQKEQFSAQTEYEKAQAALAAATAKLANLGVTATAPTEAPAASLAIKSPFAGTVIEKAAVLGEYGQAYQPLFTIADLSSLWIETNLYEIDLSRVAIGAPAIVTVNAYPDEHFAGKLTYISSMVDRQTHTVKARVELANPEGRLKPGMFANVTIDTKTQQPVLSVPEAALVLLQGQMTAFVRQGEGFVPRPVETGRRSNGRVVVKSGLVPGDEVVVSGAYALKAQLLKSQISAD